MLDSYCPLCEIRELQSLISPEYVKELASNMIVEKGGTTDDDIYHKRLTVCETCDAFRGRMVCAYCGSYVAFRARPAAAFCPYPGKNKWEDI